MEKHLALRGFAFLSMVSLAAQGVTWRPVPATMPPSRTGYALANDPVRGRVVLFGGTNAAGHLQDTWEWDGTAWQQRFPSTQPFARVGAALAFHPGLGQMLLYGGNNDPQRSWSTAFNLGDAWLWDGTTWILAATGPAPWESPQMVTDEANGTVLMKNSDYLYEWRGGAWQPLVYLPQSMGSVSVSLGYDRRRGVAVMTHEEIFSYYLPYPPYWVTTRSWALMELRNTLVGVASLPPNVQSDPPPFFDLEYDEARARMVLRGNDAVRGWITLEWDGQSLVDTTPSVGPTVTWGHLFADSARARTLVASHDLSSMEEYASVAPATFAPFGSGCGNVLGVPDLRTGPWSRPWIGDTLALRVGQVPAGAFAALAAGLSRTQWQGGPLPSPLAGFGLPGCDLLVSPDAVLPLTAAGGEAAGSLAVPRNTSLVGTQLHLQAAVLQASGASLGAVSNAATATVGAR